MKRFVLFSALLVAALNAVPVQAADTFVTRLSEGMKTWKMSNASGRWWSCGVSQTPEEVEKISAELATRIEEESTKNGINAWGLAGVIAKESKFDECALGLKSRNLGYETGILKKKRLTISETAENVLKVIRSKRWKKEIGKADMGLPQVMYPTIYRGDPAALLTREVGVKFAALEMASRAVKMGKYVAAALLRPWGGWPGWYSTKYDDSVVRYARRLGATEEDLSSRPKHRVKNVTMTTRVR
jgi:hypothetical protein